MKRRSFLAVLGATVMALALPWKATKEERVRLWGDGVHDDTLPLQLLFNGTHRLDGHWVVPVSATWSGKSQITHGTFLISRTIHIPRQEHYGSRGKLEINNIKVKATDDFRSAMLHYR